MRDSAEGPFSSVVLDVDSTLCAIEGIDWLASRLGPTVGAEIRALTERAMRGEIPLERVYGARLSAVHPSADDIAALAEAYVAALLPGALDTVQRLLRAYRRVVMVSGGIRQALLPLSRHLGITEADVHAVSVQFNRDGSYAGFDTHSPLTGDAGKPAVVRALALPPRVLAVGDGNTDLAIRPAVDCFAAFTGVIARAPVVAGADVVLNSFDQIAELVLA